MNRIESMERDRAALDCLIHLREQALNEEADIAADIWEAVHFDDLDPEAEAEDANWLDHAEAALARRMAKRSQIESEASELAAQCVPVAAIFALPDWLKEEMFGPQ